MYLHHSQIVKMDVTVVLFVEFPNLQFHYDPIFDSLYITGACHFCLYFFAHKDFVILLVHPLFDLAAPYIAISLQVAHPVPPALASPLQVVPSFSLDDDEDPSEASTSSHGSSFRPSNSYTPAEPGMANGFLFLASDQRPQPPSRLQCIAQPYFGVFMTLGHRFSVFLYLSEGYCTKMSCKDPKRQFFTTTDHFILFDGPNTCTNLLVYDSLKLGIDMYVCICVCVCVYQRWCYFISFTGLYNCY